MQIDEFKTNKLEPILQEAKQGQRSVYFMDAAHFVLAPRVFMEFLYSSRHLLVENVLTS